MTTKQLLNQYVWLRDEIALHGPSERLLLVRRGQNLIVRFYRAFETDRPLTARDAANLTAASVVNKQITGVLREWREGATASQSGRRGAAKRVR
jgi:hypothetical protein